MSTLTITSVRDYAPLKDGFRVNLSNGDAVSVVACDIPGMRWESAYIAAGSDPGDWDIRRWTEADSRSGGYVPWLHLEALGLS